MVLSSQLVKHEKKNGMRERFLLSLEAARSLKDRGHRTDRRDAGHVYTYTRKLLSLLSKLVLLPQTREGP